MVAPEVAMPRSGCNQTMVRPSRQYELWWSFSFHLKTQAFVSVGPMLQPPGFYSCFNLFFDKPGYGCKGEFVLPSIFRRFWDGSGWKIPQYCLSQFVRLFVPDNPGMTWYPSNLDRFTSLQLSRKFFNYGLRSYCPASL